MGAIEVEGLRELNAAIRRSVDSELPKRMGQANKQIGELVIARLRPSPDPAAVGLGRGSDVRASASKREVMLRVGGAHRAAGPLYTKMQPWGIRRLVRPGRATPPRPYIRGTAETHRDEIVDAYLRAITAAMGGAFADTKP